MKFVVCSPEGPEGAKAQLQRHELEGTPALAEVSSFFFDGQPQASKAVGAPLRGCSAHHCSEVVLCGV